MELDLRGIECEEALMVMQMSLRKRPNELKITTSSQPFILLLKQWALCHPEHNVSFDEDSVPYLVLIIPEQA